MTEPIWDGIEAARDQAVKAARAARGVSVLLRGETGSGKEVLARWIHDNSPSRAQGHFIAVNTAALPENLLESELFGHKKGAFTGADAERKGQFREADGGTVFLDEIGEMPTTTQVKLLRVLQDQRVRPVGSDTEIQVNVLVIAATNADLEEMIQTGRFRQDLYHRLSVVEVRIPPLRERRQAIAPLLRTIVMAKAAEFEREPRNFDGGAVAYLCGLPLPGNVRDLEKVVANVLLEDDSDTVGQQEVERILREDRISPVVQSGPFTEDVAEVSRDSLELRAFLEQCESYQKASPALRDGAKALAKALQAEMLAGPEHNGSALFKSLKIPETWVGFELVALAIAAVMGWDMTRSGLDPGRRQDRIDRYGQTWGKSEAQLGPLHRRVLEHLGVHRIDRPIY